jgi:hypothetical protein
MRKKIEAATALPEGKRVCWKLKEEELNHTL